MRDYPEDYKGPKAGQSEDGEWIEVRDYQAYLWITNGTWNYSDFDCYLYAMCRRSHELGKSCSVDINLIK